MIAIQLVLILALLLILARFLLARGSSQTQSRKVIFVLFTFAASIFISAPNLLNRIAESLGVGRGADLLLYGLTIAFIFSQLNQYVKSKEDQQKIVILARKIAIMEALYEKRNQKN